MMAAALEAEKVKARRAALRRWHLLWAVAAIVLGILLARDAAADSWLFRATRWAMGSTEKYSWENYRVDAATQPNAPWYRTMTPPLGGKLYKKTETLWRVLPVMGEFYATLIIAAVLWVYDRRRWRAAAILLGAAALAGGFGALLAATLGRYRPMAPLPGGAFNDGGNVWICLRGLGYGPGGGNLSFPSGHATLAFATAAALAYLSPRGKWLFVTLAGLCAWSRVVLGAHFYADVLAGGVLGYSLGRLLAWILGRLIACPAEPAHKVG